jgi:MFS transporter, OPA family, glycerol-3-phosphate transporter
MGSPEHTSEDQNAASAVRFTGWHAITLGALFVGYAGYYVCRSNLSVVGHEKLGLDKGALGDIFSIGVFLYAIGKVVNGIAADYMGGRALFLFGMFASVAATVAFGFGNGWWFFAVVWGINRFVQSMGWGGLVQVSGRWYREKTLATVMGILAVSYFIGDAAARYYLGWLLGEGLGWRGLFFASAGTLAVIAVGCLIALKASPRDVGLPEPEPPSRNVFGSDRGGGRPESIRRLLGPLFASTTFWLVCILSLGMTMIREAFGNWSPTYLHEAVGMDPADAAKASMTFSLVGAASSVLAGWASDRLGGNYGRIIALPLFLLVGALIALAAVPVRGQPALALALIAIASFCLLGPYTFCSGVLALSLGGQRGGATAAGLIDSAGYFGAILAGTVLGRIIEHYDWTAAFLSLAGVALLTALAAVVYWLRQETGS